VGAAPDGWLRYADAYQAPAEFSPGASTRGTDTLLLYFTSGTTARPKLVEHTHASYPVGHLSTMYWIGLAPATPADAGIRRRARRPGHRRGRRGRG